MVIAAFVASKAARDAILLSNFSIKWLPLFIAIAAVTSLPVILVAGRLLHRFGPARLVPLANLFSAAMLVVEWLLLESFPRPAAVMVFIHLSTAAAVLVSGFWSIVNERFDVQTAKRHIGRIGMGATLGGIMGGVIAERTAVYLPADMVLLVLAVMQAVCAIALYTFGAGIQHDKPAEVPGEGPLTTLKDAAKQPLLRNIGLIVVLTAVAAGIMDYVFKADIVAGAAEDSLLRSLALFYTITNVITAVFQLALTGPLIARLGVPRSVATLPLVMSGLGVFTLLVPGAMSAAVARSGELVIRNSLYRSSYELLYAPLSEEKKRPTKVVLDVGADKVGDILGAQVVSLIVFVSVIDVRTTLLMAALVAGVLALMFAARLPRAYTKALEQSLLERADEVKDDIHTDPAEPWVSLNGMPTSPNFVPLRVRSRRKTGKRKATQPHMVGGIDAVVEVIKDLRSPDVNHIRRALAKPMPKEAATHLIELVGRDDVAGQAMTSLISIAKDATGVIADALLDPDSKPAVRRRLPGVILHGHPDLAVWALWRSLADPSFDVRYRAGAMLAKLAADGHLRHVSKDEVFEAVRRELGTDPQEWRSRDVVHDLVEASHPSLVKATDDDVRSPSNLEHVFRVLGLVLPAEPLRIALHAVQTDEPSLRGTALEYLESILPADVRAQLWPMIETGESVPSEEPKPEPRVPSNSEELLIKLRTVYPDVLARLSVKKSA
ncbi:MAG: hypothetical protein H0T46_34390 [Deltaproteobacteria bacterium]|nr:hypothetical protein [Deltaproteobacteria bacterium]